jgi:uncharacterized protein YjbJ (UPF0337 family)
MNKDEVTGKGENLKGRVKEAFGSLTGDKRKQADGLFDRIRGAVREKLGKTKREVSRDMSRGDDDED